MDLNDRVKRILKYKIKEYLDWRKRSEQELRKRYQVEKAWLKSQVNAMKLYTRWARPYLIATQKLMPIEKIEGAEDIVTAFDVARIDVTLFGTKEINEIERPGQAPLKVEIPENENKVYACIEVEFRYRTSPGVVAERGHFVHRGRIDMFFKPYVMTGAQLKKMKQLEEDEVLRFLEGMTGESLEAMREELEKYLEEYDIKKIKEKLEKLETNKERIEYLEKILKEVKEEELKKEVQKLLNKYKAKIKIPLDFTKPIEEFVKIILPEKKMVSKKVPRNIKLLIKKLKSIAKEKAAKDCWTLYDTYKNAHKMVRW